jgi:predicted dehydrogenase
MIGQIMHLPYLKELEEYELTAVCDASPKLTKRIAEHYGVPFATTDWREFVSHKNMDAIVILTINHSEIAISAARAGKHVLCEKPVTFSVKEGLEVKKAVDKAGVVFMVAYMKRYDDGYLLGKKYFDAMKKSGDVRLIEVHDVCFDDALAISSMYDIWRYNDIPEAMRRENTAKMNARLREAMGAGAPDYVVTAYRLLLETGSHDVNVLRGAFGAPKRVLSTEVWPGGNWLTSTLEYDGDVRCVFSMAVTARNWGDEHITAYGMSETVSVEFPNPFHRNEPTFVNRISMKGDITSRESIKASHAEAFKCELRHFHECITKNKKPLTSLEEGIEDTALMTDMIKAFSRKRA